jgi:hypothetical protein
MRMNIDYRRGFEDALELVLQKTKSMDIKERRNITQMVDQIKAFRLEEIESSLNNP